MLDKLNDSVEWAAGCANLEFKAEVQAGDVSVGSSVYGWNLS